MPFFILFLILLIFTPCFSQTLNESPDQIWGVGDRRWTVEEEGRFGKWVEETVTEDFFIRYRIPTDCADAVYAIRWIYSRVNHLPAAATTTDGKWIGHWSTDWKHLPTHPEWHQDERFLTALLSLFPKTWTGTLPLDTYPVRISLDAITPGTLFLVTESHTGMIRRVFLDGSQAHPLQTWESASPVKVQKLNLGYLFSPRPEFKARSGLVKFRWPVFENGEWKYLPIKDHLFYSEEQYTSDFCKGYADFVDAVAKRIDPKNYDPKEKIAKVMETTTRFLRERVPLVLSGYQQCRYEGYPKTSELREIHSTSGRDGMIILLMDHLSKLIELNHLDREWAKGRMEAIAINISENRSVTFYHAYQNHLWFSSDPRDSIEARWGLEKCEMIRAQAYSTHDSIAFIERTYRKKDPKYADFSVRQQQHILRKLNREWVESECREPLPTQGGKVRVSSPPRESIEVRWGSRGCEKILAEIRSIHDSLAFIEKTYRKKDPEYADFSVRQQQHILGRLSEEWTESGCREPLTTRGRKAMASSPPRESTEARLGSRGCEKIRAEVRSIHDSIAFIERTYRKKDPEYADFSVRQQQHLLQRLSEEWAGSECKGSFPRREK